MNHTDSLLALGKAMRQAAADHDWIEVQLIDISIASLLGELKNATPDAELRNALETVQHIHHQVMEYCQAKSDAIADNMSLSRRNREGVVAYASFMGTEDSE